MAKNITETARLLVVSQESSVLRPLWAIAEPNSWNIETASSAWDAIERVQSGGAPDLLLLTFPAAIAIRYASCDGCAGCSQTFLSL